MITGNVTVSHMITGSVTVSHMDSLLGTSSG